MPTPRVTIDELPEQGAIETANLLIVHDGDTTKKMTVATLQTMVPSALSAHFVADGAHIASNIDALNSGNGIDGLNVQEQLVQLSTQLAVVGGGTVTDVIWVGDDEPVDAAIEMWYDTDATGGSTVLSGVTVDTDELYKIILFSDGTCRAIPYAATAPEVPTGLTPTVRVNSVKLTWVAPAGGAASYVIYRDGVAYATSTMTTYRDTSVVLSTTYDYSVQAVSAYALRSAITAEVSAFIDPALNIAPVVEVRAWPLTVAVGNRAVIRVNQSDADAQVLATLLETDVGTLIATADPTVWLLEPV